MDVLQVLLVSVTLPTAMSCLLPGDGNGGRQQKKVFFSVMWNEGQLVGFLLLLAVMLDVGRTSPYTDHP